MMAKQPVGTRRSTCYATAVAIALVAGLPFGRGLLRGECFFFRDLSRAVFPQKLFLAQGLLQGELRHWNPYVHEGEALRGQSLGYPLDLLHVLVPSEWGLSLVLAAHVPLAALAFMALARQLALAPLAAAAGALVYALAGFPLSLLNLGAALQAHAWAPLVVRGLIRASQGRWADSALAAVPIALLASTGAAEFVAQAFLIGVVLALSRSPTRLARLAGALALGCGLAAYVLLPMSGLVEGSSRGRGLDASVVLAHSVHPVTWLQVVVGGLYGDPSDLTNRWQGQNFFPRGFPYILSLYEGLAVLLLAALGAWRGGGPARRLAALGLVASLLCLGRYAGLGPLVEATPPALRVFRYATKAFFTVHFTLALLAALGIGVLARPCLTAWRHIAAFGLAVGSLFVFAPLLPRALPDLMTAFIGGFFAPEYAWATRWSLLGEVLRDAATGGAVAAACGGVALCVARRYLAPDRGGLLLVALVASDLLRTGAGLNTVVVPSFYRTWHATADLVAVIREAGGRLYTCEPSFSSAYYTARAARNADHEVWTFAVEMESLSPNYNIGVRVPSALSPDLTMLVPEQRVLPASASDCRALAELEGLWRRAGVAWVLALDPLVSPALRQVAVIAPPRIAPLRLHLYALADPLPLRAVAKEVFEANGREEAELIAEEKGFQLRGAVAVEGGRPVASATGRIVERSEQPGNVELVVESDRPTVVVVRDAWDRGWTAEVGSAPAPVLRADGRHMAVPVPGGRSRVVLSYRPPRLASGVALSGLAALVCLILVVGPGVRDRARQL